MDTQEFIDQASKGESALEHAIRSLIQAHGRMIYQRCARDLYRFQVTDHDIEDCAQETFLKAWRFASGFRGDSNILTWLETVRRSVVNDFRDKLSRRQEVPLNDSEGMTEPLAEKILNEAAMEAKDKPDLELERLQLRECLARQMEAFGQRYPNDVMVLQWIVLDGIGNEELSTLLKRSSGAAREFKSQLMKKARTFFDRCRALARGTHP